MSQRIDAECGLLHKEDSQDARVDETTSPIAPAKSSDGHGKEDPGDEHYDKVMLMLEPDDGILVEVCDISTADSPWILLHDHPAEMTVEETLADTVRVFVGVGVSVVSSMISGPPSNGALHASGAAEGEEDLER